jgi:LmbE family N-acetylglucosaminyl deacetylase
MKIVVVSPHRDDAAFSLGLAIGFWLAQGHAVEVVNVFTRSEFAPYSDAESLHPNDRMSFVSAVLKREEEAWVKLYVGQLGRGKLKLTDLNLKDAPVRLHCLPAEALTRQPEPTEKVTQKLRRALESSAAEALMLPLGVGHHVDHLLVREACLPTDPRGFPLAFYEDLPRVAAGDGHAELEAAVQAATLLVGVPLQPVFVADASDVEAAVVRKQRLALCYDSQVNDATTQQIADYSRQYGGRERLWANAAWGKSFSSTGA